MLQVILIFLVKVMWQVSLIILVTLMWQVYLIILMTVIWQVFTDISDISGDCYLESFIELSGVSHLARLSENSDDCNLEGFH